LISAACQQRAASLSAQRRLQSAAGETIAYKNYGALDVATSLVGHLSFGALTGLLYGVFHSGAGLAL
jgi:hypothetical protein